MKRIFSLFLALAMCISLSACSGSSTKKAFTASKEAYDNIDAAYSIVSAMGTDIYEAWRLGIYDDDEILDEGVSYLASELYLTEDELRAGTAYLVIVSIYGEDWDEASDDDKETYADLADVMFSLYEDSLFSYCVRLVSASYTVNGKVAEAQEYLDNAKAQMKEMSEKYSDYEHYPNLKGYYTTTSAFFDFCQSPTGSFNQLATTINDYKNTAREYQSDLNYIFED